MRVLAQHCVETHLRNHGSVHGSIHDDIWTVDECRDVDKQFLPQATSLVEAGSILSWLSPHEDEAYSNMHCDKANNFEYDVGALLYLSCSSARRGQDRGGDFTGGSLEFQDPVWATDAIMPEELPEKGHHGKVIGKEIYSVEPDVGLLTIFSSSIGNLHRVCPVEDGNRLLLSVWFSLK